MKYTLSSVVLLVLIASCVPNKKLVYLQKNDLSKNVRPTNEVIREHMVDTFNYRIQPNDILSVRFESLTPKSFDFLSNQAASQSTAGLSGQGNPLLIGELVDEDGNIMLPGLGSFKVSGLTIFQLQQHLKKAVEKYIDSPIVRVRLLNYRVTILGEVNKEGTVVLMNNRVSIMEALGIAGGLNDFADKSAVKLIRQEGSKAQVVYLNLLDESLIDSPYYYIHQNDILIVPPLNNRPFRKYFSQNLSLLLSVVSIGLIIVTLNK
jgi:polysaccharide export outer membrane protein